MVAIIIVNWNGFEDTIECLNSLHECKETEFFVLLCDNGSTNDSVEKITKHCTNKWPFNSVEVTDTKPDMELKNGHVILYKLGQNNGFSRGNNLGLHFASLFNPDFYLLLNNDTVVEPDFLTKLIDYQKSYPDEKVLTPLIHYFYDKTLIWNGGGNIYWGFRKYHYTNKHESTVPNKESISCTFITGCALFFVPELLDTNHDLLSERFFFGEEDVEFSLRMKKNKVKMACVLKSVIYHKVGGSRKSNNKKFGFTYIHYLNRLINVRHYMPKWQYPIYKIVLFADIFRILKKVYDMQVNDIISFIKKLNKDSINMEGVSKSFFLETVNSELIS